MKTVDAVALGALALCIAGTIECSNDVRGNPPLFASLLFFALSWALLLPYYYLQANPQQGEEQRELVEILSAYSAILLMLTAVPLRQGLGNPGHVDAISVWAMRAIYLIVLPHGAAFIPQVHQFLHTRIVAVVHLLLALAGFALITHALWFLTRKDSPLTRGLWWVLLVVATAYAISYGGYVARHAIRSSSYKPLPDSYKWLFVFLKIAFCSVFLAVILRIA
jgi:hypothetical protein